MNDQNGPKKVPTRAVPDGLKRWKVTPQQRGLPECVVEAADAAAAEAEFRKKFPLAGNVPVGVKPVG